MKQVNIHGPDDVRIDDVEAPEPGPRDVVVRVSACGICGSDLGYIAGGGVAGPTGEPMPLGHEFSGIVDRIGAEVSDIPVGQRVVVNPLGANNQIGNGGPEGAFAPELLVRNAADGGCVLPIPDSLPMDLAALAEPLAVGLQVVERCRATAGDKAVIFGAGPIGLAAVAALRHRGVRDIVSVDLSERRLEIARKLGVRETLNPGSDDIWQSIRELHGTAPVLGVPMAGSDLYIEASGASVLIDQILSNARSEARLGIVGLHRTPVPVNFLVVMIKSMNIIGSMAYPDDWSETLEILTHSDLSPMVTHRYPLESFHDALSVARDPKAGAKVLVVNESH